MDAATPWRASVRVARLIAADPHGCGGVLVRAGAGPVRDAWLGALRGFLAVDAQVRRLPLGIADDRLIGGLDLAATLSAGRPVSQRGLLAEADGGLVVVPMAERLPAGTAARLAAALDTGTVRVERDGLAEIRPARFGLILLDEGIGEEERAPEVLAERLAFHIDLTDVAWRDVEAHDPPPSAGEGARRMRGGRGDRDLLDDGGAALSQPSPPQGPLSPAEGGGIIHDVIATLCQVAAALGVLSLRGPLLAARIARIAAGLDGRAEVEEADTIEAARLVLAPRATRLPPSNDESKPSPEEPAQDPAEDAAAQPSDPLPETRAEREAQSAAGLDERVVEAAHAAIPAGLLAKLAEGGLSPRAPKAGRIGASAASPRSGRPAGSRPGDPRSGRLNLIETLRAAAPWQRLRRAAGEGRRIVVRPEDVRITRFKQRTETTTIFAVDASGSAALERLAEAKGAVELLLAEAYIRRDRVALVAFRGRGAELILPPTRSLVRAKRGLSALPGGGGTPLASGIDVATAVALGVRRGGGTPVLVMLTDGRANVGRSGEPGRAQAGTDALNAAAAFRATGIRAIFIDTAPRPQEIARRLAAAMDARYLALPYADAGQVSGAVKALSEEAR
ncbi:magnesium chelatase subunit D [uncultured Methylobacterium sp.]|uniref:magnesium chelatase subunit D n=1 Tax=uncultured Methylobacterium sp. TaxID=157278 RepID=UPI0035CC20DB